MKTLIEGLGLNNFLFVFFAVFVIVTWVMAWSKLIELKKENQVIRLKNQLSQNLFNQISDSVLILDQKGIILNTNATFLDLIERQEDTIIGRSVQYLHSDFDYNEHNEKMSESFSQKKHYDFSSNIFLKTGKIIPFQVKACQYRIKGKIYLCLSGVNVKESSQQESKIDEMRAELNEIQRLANTGYWEMNYETKKIYWSKQLYNILGYQENEVKPNLDFVHSMAEQNDQNRVWKAFLDAFQRQEKVDTYYRLKNNRGEIIDIYLRIRHFFSEKNEHIRTIGILQDISERMELKKELNNHQVFSEMILNNSHLLYLSFTREFEVGSINPLMSDLIGLAPDEVKGMPLLNVFGNLNAKHKRFINNNLDFKQPLPLKDKDEKLRYIQWDYGTVTLKTNDVLNFLVGIDITEAIDQRKALEVSLLKDEITGLPNRKRLNQVLINYFEKNGERVDKPLTLMCIHIDGIQFVADGCGQVVEDYVLNELSIELNDRLKRKGLLAKRYFNQFTFFYPEGRIERIDSICNDIIEGFKMKFQINCCQVNLKPYIGIARFPNDAKNRNDLIRFASASMRQAKETNQNRVYFSKQIEMETLQKIERL